MVKACNKEKTSPRAQGHGDPIEKQHCGSYDSNRPDGQDLPLLLSASRCRSCLLPPELCKLLFFIFTTWNPSIYLPGITPVSTQWLHKRSTRNISFQGRNTSRCSLFLSFWENDMTEIPASLNLGNFLMEMTVVSLKSLGAASPYTPRSTWGISLYLSVPLKAVWPQYCTAAITGSADRKWNLKQPSLIDGLPDTGFPCFRAL